MSAYSTEVRKEGDREFHAIWDQIRNGYVPILPVGFDINGAIGKRSVATVMNSLELLHVPHLSYKKRLAATSVRNIEQCTKLHFLVSLLDEIRNAKCPITIAIVASTADREVLFSQALEVYFLRHNYAFSKLHSQGKTKSPLYGVRVQFATKKSLEKANDILTVDYVIVYDSSLIPHRNDILSDFKGITYEKPGIISLVSFHTPDIRLCNYRDAHPDLFKDPHAKIKSLPLAETKIFKNISYRRAGKDQRVKSNKEMVKKVKNWMFLNDQTIFKPTSIKYPQVDSFQTNPEIPTKQSTDNDGDADTTDNTDNDNGTDNDTDIKQNNTPDCKNTNTASCSVNPSETTQKRIQPNSGNDSPKKQKTGKGTDKDGANLRHIITLADSSDDDTTMKDGGIGDPIEIISSDAMSDTSDDASSEDELGESDESDELDDSSSDESMSSTIDTTPIPESNTTSKPAQSATSKDDGDVVMAEKEESAIKIIEESGKSANEAVVNGKSVNKTIERKSVNKAIERKSVNKSIERISVNKTIEGISVKDTMEVDMVKSTRPQSALAQSLRAFQMELDQLHADFVRRISQN